MPDDSLETNRTQYFPPSDLPLSARIRLGHALIEFLSIEAGIDLLHVKGYAAEPGLYAPGRLSSDVDVLVRPSHIDLLVDVLSSNGWAVMTTFQSGSIFRHAMTLWNNKWGHLDIHRFFPGIGLDPDDLFNLLWTSRHTQTIANRPCRVPSTMHHALLIVLHGARDPHRGPRDVQFLREALGQVKWAELEQLAVDVEAGLSFAAATGCLDQWVGHQAHDLWSVVSRGGTRTELFHARWRAALSLSERWALIRTSLFVNRDHLRMKLRTDPKLRDYLEELLARFSEASKAIFSRQRGMPDEP